jgi:hypothetical protein
MFAKLLNKGLGSSLTVLISLFVLAFVSHLFTVIPIDNNQFPDLFYNYFTNKVHQPIAIVAINFVCILMGMLIIQNIGNYQEVVDKQNFFPVFFYVLFCAPSTGNFNVSAQLLTNVFILLSLNMLLDTYREDEALRKIFNAAFFLGISVFVSIAGMFTFPLFFIILIILRPFHWREWVIALIGLCVPFFIYECLAYLSDFNQWYFFKSAVLFFRSMRTPHISEFYMPLLLWVVFMFLLALLQSVSLGFGNTVKKQKSKLVLLWFVFFSFLAYFSSGANGAGILMTLAVPMSFFIGDYFFNLKQKKISNTLLSIAILSAILIFLGKLGLV